MDGSRTGLSGGICGRTKEVRDELVRLTGAADCSAVTTTDLRELTGTLSLRGGAGIATLKLGDFADLPLLRRLFLNDNLLIVLPEGLFNGLGVLRGLYLSGNGLKELPEGLFNGLSMLEVLTLNGNAMTALDADLFAGLSELKTSDS